MTTTKRRRRKRKRQKGGGILFGGPSDHGIRQSRKILGKISKLSRNPLARALIATAVKYRRTGKV